MAIAPNGHFIVGGMESGEIALFNPTDLSQVGRVQTNLGDLYGLAVHPTRPLAATLGMDNCITLVDIKTPTRPRVLNRFNTRNLQAWNDLVEIDRNCSQSQALAFHPTAPRIASRNARAAVLELNYDEVGRLELIHCTRFHGLEDVTTVQYQGADSLTLVSAALGSMVFSRDGLTLDKMRIADGNVHWFEPIGNGRYLVAADDRRIRRFNMTTREVEVEGPVFTLDDLEHVHFNSTSGRAFVVGFDRMIYEIDPDTCVPLSVIYRAPFKMRWFKTLPNAPDVGYAQCFDGAIYKIDISSGIRMATTRRTPPPLWSICKLPGKRLAATGEGNEVVLLSLSKNVDAKRIVIKRDAVLTKPEQTSYTKRMVAAADGTLYLAQTSGNLLRMTPDGNESAVLTAFDSAVRDVAVDPSGQYVFVCLEEGRACRIHAETGVIAAEWWAEGLTPLWALAHNMERHLLAVGERHGNILLLDDETLDIVHTGPVSKRVKRIQWLDEHRLAYNRADCLWRYDLEEDSASEWVGPRGNTIEDFCWSERYGYLFFIGYTTEIGLCDFETGELLYLGADQEDYSKGVLALEDLFEQVYPLEVLTFGRSGQLHGFRPHNEMLTAHGPVTEPLLKRNYL